jgi:hypothetical protein
MRRKLFTLAAGVSAALCAAVCVLWVAAQFSQRQWVRGSVARLSSTEAFRADAGVGWDRQAIAIQSCSQIGRCPDPAKMDDWYPRWAAHPPGISVDGWNSFRIYNDRDYWCPLRTESMRLYLRRRGIVVPFLDAAFWSAVLPCVWG